MFRVYISLILLKIAHANAIYKSCDLEVPLIRTGNQRVEIKSPQYPKSFPTQTQCKWIIEAPPGRRIKLQFTEWSVPQSGTDCEVVFISITDADKATSLEQDTKKKAVSFCGRNPGTFVSASAKVELAIHSDSDPDATRPKLFRAFISSTTDPSTQVTAGQTVSHGHVDQRYQKPVEFKQVDVRQQQAPQVYQANKQHIAVPAARAPMPAGGRPAYGYPAPPVMGYPAVYPPVYPAVHQGQGHPVRGQPVAPPRGGYSVPSAQAPPPVLPRPMVPGMAPKLDKLPSGPKFLPKNYAKDGGKTREDKNGRVNTNLIKSLQKMKQDGTLDKHLAKSAVRPKPVAGLAPGESILPGLPPGMPPVSLKGAFSVSRKPVLLPPNEQYGPPVFNKQGGVAYPPIRLKSVGEMTSEAEIIPETEIDETDQGSAKLIVMIGIATGVITVVSGIIILLIYLHKRIKKQEKADEVITQQKYMFDHTVLSRNQTMDDRSKEQVNKPRDFMDEDDVEMVRTLSRAPGRTTTNQNFPKSTKSPSSFVSSKDSGIDALSRKTKSYVTSLRS